MDGAHDGQANGAGRHVLGWLFSWMAAMVLITRGLISAVPLITESMQPISMFWPSQATLHMGRSKESS